MEGVGYLAAEAPLAREMISPSLRCPLAVSTRTGRPSLKTMKLLGTAGTRGPGKITPLRFKGSQAESLISTPAADP